MTYRIPSVKDYMEISKQGGEASSPSGRIDDFTGATSAGF